MKYESVFYPNRLLFLLQIFWLQLSFSDSVIGALFGGVLAFVTVRMFPFIEYRQKKQEPKPPTSDEP